MYLYDLLYSSEKIFEMKISFILLALMPLITNAQVSYLINSANVALLLK